MMDFATHEMPKTSLGEILNDVKTIEEDLIDDRNGGTAWVKTFDKVIADLARLQRRIQNGIKVLPEERKS
jgi:hypothetical protein